MSQLSVPPLYEIVAVWHMAFGEPPVVTAEPDLLLHVLDRFFPDVHEMLVGPTEAEQS